MTLASSFVSPTRRPFCWNSWTICASRNSTSDAGAPVRGDDLADYAEVVNDVARRPDEGNRVVADLAGDDGAGALGVAGLDGDADLLQVIGHAGKGRAAGKAREGKGEGQDKVLHRCNSKR